MENGLGWNQLISQGRVQYTGSSRAYKEVAAKSEFIHYHNHMDRRKLLTQLIRYDYGWAGLNAVRNRERLEIALPNKVVEYVACGLPVLAFPHEAIKYFIERNGVGIVGENADDLARQLGEVDLSEFRSNLKKCRQGVIIEEKIGQLTDFYRQLIEKFTPKFSTPRGVQANVVHR